MNRVGLRADVFGFSRLLRRRGRWSLGGISRYFLRSRSSGKLWRDLYSISFDGEWVVFALAVGSVGCIVGFSAIRCFVEDDVLIAAYLHSQEWQPRIIIGKRRGVGGVGFLRN